MGILHIFVNKSGNYLIIGIISIGYLIYLMFFGGFVNWTSLIIFIPVSLFSSWITVWLSGSLFNTKSFEKKSK
ncbi:hypothetical protein CLI91_14625 [Lentilactobacillus hilgardii]|nr:hypothetical protein [Lentilactobacillus hilgardii]MBZ2205499.1 hypothetical protein [Lentilactobacillus hilgardii]